MINDYDNHNDNDNDNDHSSSPNVADSPQTTHLHEMMNQDNVLFDNASSTDREDIYQDNIPTNNNHMDDSIKMESSSSSPSSSSSGSPTSGSLIDIPQERNAFVLHWPFTR
jgi:hypothetical protein